MAPPLAAPPLVEALCEFRFVANSSQAWDWALPGLLWDKLRNDYPQRSQVQSTIIIEQPLPVGTPQPIAPVERLQFRNADQSRVVQVGPHLLIFNQLKPYPGWDVFRELVLKLADSFRELQTSTALTRIGMRYINRIPLPGESELPIGDYLTLMPAFPSALSAPLGGVNQRYEFIEPELGNGRLAIATGINPGGAQQPRGLVLDLDAYTISPPAFTREAVGAWLDVAHARIGSAFIASIKPAILAGMQKG